MVSFERLEHVSSGGIFLVVCLLQREETRDRHARFVSVKLKHNDGAMLA